MASSRNSWQPPPPLVYKLNFDVGTFSNMNCPGFGAIIHNEEGEVMAGMSVKGPFVHNSAEVEALACRKAVKFSIEAGFSRLVIEGDNATMMNAISCSADNNSLLDTYLRTSITLSVGRSMLQLATLKGEIIR